MITIQNNAILFRRRGELLAIEPYGPSIIRVRVVPSGELIDNSWTLLPPQPADYRAEVIADGARLQCGTLSAKITKSGEMSFWRGDTRLLEEVWDVQRCIGARNFRSTGGGLFSADIVFHPQPDEHFYGLGHESHGCFDLKGCVIDLCQQNSKCTIPFMISSRGYGFLWNNPSIGRVDLGHNQTRWTAQATRQMDYLVIEGENEAEIVRRFCGLTGKAPPLPEWASGLWQSKLRYENQQELLEVAREYHRRGIQLSIIVCDYFHWPQQGDWKFDKRFWPDPRAMVDELADMGIRLLVSVWPTVELRSENYDEMAERNLLIRTERGPDYTLICRGLLTYYDATNPEAGKFMFEKCRQNYYEYGVRHFWLDETEPEIDPYDYDNIQYHLGNGLEVSNLYPYYHAKNFYEGQKALAQKDIVNLVRCAWLGSQRFGAVVWTGDVESTFESLRRQVIAAQHIAICGFPWWTTDTGGFLSGDPDDPSYRELYVRWFQFSVFCPILRLHGLRYRADRPKVPSFNRCLDPVCHSGGPNEIWSFGEEAYGIMRKFLVVREALRPYITKYLNLASETGTPLLRPMFHDFSDPAVYTIGDQYLFGPDILVAPVLEEGARERSVYLPKGTDWIDANSGKLHQGGNRLQVPAALDTLPLFIKEGSGILEALLGSLNRD